MTLALTPAAMEVIRVAVAAAGTLLLLWGYLLRRAGYPGAHRELRDHALLTLGLFAGLCWWNVGNFHFGNYLHLSDTYHYYIGAKYFRELGYTRLYACTVVAAADSGFRADAEGLEIRDLDTNLLTSTRAILSNPAACTRHFSKAGWARFEHDIAWFRSRMVARAVWAPALHDHGYNATPVWGILGTALAHTGPASTAQILALALLDPLLLLGMWAMVWRTFGWRAMCVALIYWGTNYPGRFYWNGGGFLRQDWLALSGIAICLLGRRRMGAAGFALTWAALLRVFPALILAGVALQALPEMWRGRRLTLAAEHRRFALGCVAAVLVLVPTSSVVMGGWESWRGFVENSRKLLDTPLTNYMGLKTVVAYDHSTRAELSAPLGLEEDPFQVWKEGRRATFHERRYLFAAVVLGFVLLLAYAVHAQEPWVAAILAIGLIPVATELTCYYYAILLGYGLVGARREGIGAGLCALAAFSGLVPMRLAWSDEVYALISGGVVLFVTLATVALARRPIRGSDASPEAAAPR